MEVVCSIGGVLCNRALRYRSPFQKLIVVFNSSQMLSHGFFGRKLHLRVDGRMNTQSPGKRLLVSKGVEDLGADRIGSIGQCVRLLRFRLDDDRLAPGRLNLVGRGEAVAHHRVQHQLSPPQAPV